jgi:hypothetical protein
MLVRQDLGPEGLEYFGSYLAMNGEFGKQLGPLLIANHDLQTASVWSFVPVPLAAARAAPLTAFEAGGLVPKRDPASRGLVREWLETKCDAGPLLLCAESALGGPTDPYVARLTQPVFFCGESVIDYRQLPSQEIVDELFAGAVWNPEVAILTDVPDVPDVPDDRSTITRAELAYLAEKAVAVVIGAWDDEGLIFWEPADAAGLGRPASASASALRNALGSS